MTITMLLENTVISARTRREQWTLSRVRRRILLTSMDLCGPGQTSNPVVGGRCDHELKGSDWPDDAGRGEDSGTSACPSGGRVVSARRPRT